MTAHFVSDVVDVEVLRVYAMCRQSVSLQAAEIPSIIGVGSVFCTPTY